MGSKTHPVKKIPRSDDPRLKKRPFGISSLLEVTCVLAISGCSAFQGTLKKQFQFAVRKTDKFLYLLGTSSVWRAWLCFVLFSTYQSTFILAWFIGLGPQSFLLGVFFDFSLGLPSTKSLEFFPWAITTGWKSPCPPLPLLELSFPVLMSQT